MPTVRPPQFGPQCFLGDLLCQLGKAYLPAIGDACGFDIPLSDKWPNQLPFGIVEVTPAFKDMFGGMSFGGAGERRMRYSVMTQPKSDRQLFERLAVPHPANRLGITALFGILFLRHGRFGGEELSVGSENLFCCSARGCDAPCFASAWWRSNAGWVLDAVRADESEAVREAGTLVFHQ